jgi:hypothetical protein
LKPFYWLRSARATQHFTACGLVETDRLTEKAEKAREGTNCIISTKAVSTVDAVHIDIEVHQDAHWWLPLFLTYPNFQTFKLSRSLTKLANRPFNLSPKLPSKTSSCNGIRRAYCNSWRGASFLRASHHGSYFISCGFHGGLQYSPASLEHWHTHFYNVHSQSQ